jgi:hypothetical protein
MAASAWAFYDTAKKKLGQNTNGIRLDTGTFRLSLHTSASNAASVGNLSLKTSVNNEITAQGGYVTHGRTLGGVAWTINGASVKFDSSDLVFTASGADLANIKYAVINYWVNTATSSPLLCYSQLSTSEFTVSNGNTLTIQMAAAGIFTLT